MKEHGTRLESHRSEVKEQLIGSFKILGKTVIGSLKDLIPIVVVIAGFQVFVLQSPFPSLMETLFGVVLVVLGLAFFVMGLEMGLFPIGEAMADALARKGSLFWLLVFSFGLGVSTTIAEPALIAISDEAAEVAAASGLIPGDVASMSSYGFGLRATVALSVGAAIALGVVRILKGWPAHVVIIAGYVIVMLMTAVAPEQIVGIAYDSGGVTTSTVTVPLVTALGVGLASSIRGRNPLVDGFGMVALASLSPMIFVMAYGLVVFGWG